MLARPYISSTTSNFHYSSFMVVTKVFFPLVKCWALNLIFCQCPAKIEHRSAFITSGLNKRKHVTFKNLTSVGRVTFIPPNHQSYNQWIGKVLGHIPCFITIFHIHFCRGHVNLFIIYITFTYS